MGVPSLVQCFGNNKEPADDPKDQEEENSIEVKLIGVKHAPLNFADDSIDPQKGAELAKSGDLYNLPSTPGSNVILVLYKITRKNKDDEIKDITGDTNEYENPTVAIIPHHVTPPGNKTLLGSYSGSSDLDLFREYNKVYFYQTGMKTGIHPTSGDKKEDLILKFKDKKGKKETKELVVKFKFS